jgi:Ribbon-helix-helix protein
MVEKQARLTVLIDPLNKAALEEICSSRQETSSEVVRRLVADFLASHGVHFDAEPAAKDPVRG